MLSITKNVLLSSYSSMKKHQKDFDDIWHKKFTSIFKSWHFLTPPGDFIWIKWFFRHIHSNFVSLPWKLHNQYCHKGLVCPISLYHSIMQPPICWWHQEMRRTSAHSDSRPRLLSHLNQAFSNFVSLPWKLHNQYCHRGRVCPISLYHSIMQPPLCWRQQEMRFLCYSQTMAALYRSATWTKLFLILYPSLENSTTNIAIGGVFALSRCIIQSCSRLFADDSRKWGSFVILKQWLPE